MPFIAEIHVYQYDKSIAQFDTMEKAKDYLQYLESKGIAGLSLKFYTLID